MGFEALLWHRPVRTFGMPFYAGWGLTDDALAAPVRRVEATRPSLDDLVHAALIEYPRYRDPETGRRCEVEAVADWLALQRRMQCRFPEEVHALDFSRWKKPIVRAFFGGSRVRFVACESDVPVGATLAVWGRRAVDATQPREVVRLEDGFLRSVGLGAALVQPLSWVMDRRGLYYDPTAPSDLEHLLEHATFTPALRERARALRERIVEARLTKYNVGSASWRRPSGQRRVILVPGQVESDASIACGTHEVRTNLGLLMAVRRAEPDAYIVYKPHPDVVARLRAAGTGEADAASWCDEVVTDGAMGDLLTEVDEVHLMTSLTGFEALLRGKRVVAHGLPFYAGWGLTDDRCHTARRNRRLTLDELVAGVLVLYPTYVSRVTGRFTTPERALVELSEWRTQARASSFLRMALARPLLARAAARRTAPADAMGRTCAASPHPLRPERRTGEAP
jgi:capsular polysaccharide export protein